MQIDNISAGDTNANMPVASKYVTKNSPIDDKKLSVSPDKLFGFKCTDDKNRTKERKAQYIHIKRRQAPMERIPPDIIY